jgi:PTH1 family peptidyl-tRNA hydrolase
MADIVLPSFSIFSMDSFLIVGLGNPGDKYTNTRHNIGFLILEALSKKHAGVFSSGRFGTMSEIRLKGRRLFLLCPDTFMNLSGKAVIFHKNKLELPSERILVVTDDLALPFGTLRMKKKGSDGGHNGLASVQESLQSADYPRLRFGIGNEFIRGKQVDYVLGNWSAEESAGLVLRIPLACEMIETFVLAGIEKAMTDFNGR